MDAAVAEPCNSEPSSLEKKSLLQRYREFASGVHLELRASRRPEVRLVNRYAVIMGYQMLAVKVIGYLVLVWSTVVLLGGFVTLLAKKDFWCLAAITVIQSAGVFTALTDDQSAYFWESLPSFDKYLGDLACELREKERSSATFATAIVLRFANLIFLVLYVFILYPVAAVYLYGLFISPVLALMRLAQHDYGNGDADPSKANLKPALILLYSLAMLQGILFLLGGSYIILETIMVKVLAKHYELEDKWGCRSVKQYIVGTRNRCFKDPQFARGRNLITFAVDLLESESPEKFHNGAWLLDKLIKEHKQKLAKRTEKQTRHLERLTERQKQHYLEKLEECQLHVKLNWASRYSYNLFGWQISWFKPTRQEKLLKQMRDMFIEQKDLKTKLIDSASSKSIIQTLLHKLGKRSTEQVNTMECIARIVTYVARDIHLEQFPGEIQCISSLLETSERDWHHNAQAPPSSPKERIISDPHNGGSTTATARASINTQCRQIMLQGLCIFEELASNEDNFKVISNTECLLSKIMVPVSSDLLHLMDHAVWYDIVMGSLKVMRRLMAAPKETGSKLLGEMASNREAISSMQGILQCDNCGLELQKLAMEILTKLFMDTSLRMESASKRSFTEMLLHKFIDDNKDSSIRKLAGEALAKVSLRCESYCMIIIQLNDDVVHSLTKIMLQDENNTYRIIAAKILEGLCIHYTKNDDSCQKLQNAMIEVMPEVLREILRCGSGGEVATERENQNGNSEGNERNNSTSSSQQNDEKPEVGKLQAALLSPIAKVFKNILCCGSREEIRNKTEADGAKPPIEATDLENQNGISEDNERNNSIYSSQQNCEKPEDGKLQAALLSLIARVLYNPISEDQVLSIQLDPVAPGDTALSFVGMLKEIVKKNSQPTPNCLRILKVTSTMVISMMKHGSSYLQEDLEGLMESLSAASKLMVELDIFMLFSSGDDAETKPVRTLTSLVKVAKQLADEKRTN
uniref:Uncharacterized protein n=1 Tax=Oryza punctata TaxID=4537 RepID=A0A0E0MND6_ORYPU